MALNPGIQDLEGEPDGLDIIPETFEPVLVELAVFAITKQIAQTAQ